MANDITTLHVHFGMHHTVSKQCGLCDKEFESTKELDDHHSHCDIFQCINGHCKDTFEKVEDIKEHIKEEHKKNSPPHYQFSYFIMNTKDKSEIEVFKNYITIYPKDW